MKKMRMNNKRKLALYLMLLPSLMGFCIFYLFPYVLSLSVSLFANPTFDTIIWFKNYAALFESISFRLAMRNTLRFVLFAVPLNVGLALLLALWLRGRKLFSGVLKGSALMPMAVPAVSVAVAFHDWFQLDGIMNRLISANTDYLTSKYSFHIAIIMFLWKNTGTIMLLMMIGLESIPEKYYDCAALDTNRRWTVFINITAVYLRPTLFFVIVFSIINVFRMFRDIHLLFGNYPNKSVYMLQHFMNNHFYNLDYSKLCTAAFVVSAIIYVFVHFLYHDERRNHDAISG